MIGPHHIHLIVCVDGRLGIGKGGDLPWRLKKEMAFFKKQTLETKDPNKQNMVIMGRGTWESIPDKYRPLPGRCNVILTRNHSYASAEAFVASDLDRAFALCGDHIEDIYIIGGASVYESALYHAAVDGVYLTKLEEVFDCDRFFPPLPQGYEEEILGSEEENGIHFTYTYQKNTNPHEETTPHPHL